MKLKILIGTITLGGLMIVPLAVASPEVREQDFIITAYYSPEPNQCCYVQGSYEDDVAMNGQGIRGADYTPVYPGMAAAPSTYAFGTRIALPGIGAVTVHDRGGAIVEGDETHRLDLWMGHGEEGLARALAFGVRHVRGTVYPTGVTVPVPPEQFSLAQFPAPVGQLTPTPANQPPVPKLVMEIRPRFGEQGHDVTIMQEALTKLGYFQHETTGTFGDVTRTALAAFQADYGIQESPETVGERTAVALQAADLERDAKAPIEEADRNSSESTLAAVRRTLRYLGYYNGTTVGPYDDALFDAILAFQKDQALVGGPDSIGAGRVGPKTREAMINAWRKKRVAQRAGALAVFQDVGERLQSEGALLEERVDPGDSGRGVERLQRTLAELGFFPRESINGWFGPVTKTAVAQYQVSRKLLGSVDDVSAGRVGPITMHQLNVDRTIAQYHFVRAHGWEAW